MPQYAQIKLTSPDLDQLERLAWEIKEIAEKTVEALASSVN